MPFYEFAREYDTESMMNFKVIIDTLKTARELMEKAYDDYCSSGYEVEIVPKYTRRPRNAMNAYFIEYIGEDESPQFITEFMTYTKDSWDEVCGVSPISFHEIFLGYDLYDVTKEKRLCQQRLDRHEEAQRHQEALERQYETTSEVASEEDEEEEDEEEEYIDDDISDQQACLCCCNVSSEQMDDALENASKLPEGLYVYYANLLKKLYKSSPKIVISKKRYLNFFMKEIQLKIKIEKKKSKRKRKKEF